MNQKVILFETRDGEAVLEASLMGDTVWMSGERMAELFGVEPGAVIDYIADIFAEGELDCSEHVQGVPEHLEPQYDLDVILAVGYRVHSPRGTEFRIWADRILKQYILEGVAVNEKRVAVLQKTVDIQNGILEETLNSEQQGVLQAVQDYTRALELLDRYDHQSLKIPEGRTPVYQITYEDVRTMVAHMEDNFSSDVFGVEKEEGKIEGILAAVYQNVFGSEVYPSVEEKAANLIYFMIKDHPFADGCKRIAASLFLEFLHRNHVLYRNGKKVISDGALVAMTLMIAESKADEKEIITNLVMNLLAL